MAAPRKRPADLTGTRKVQLQEQHAEELAAREGEIALMDAAKRESDKEVVDYTNGAPKGTDEPDVAPIVTPVVEVKQAFVTIRLNSKIEQMTFGKTDGRLNNFDFEEGRQYRVSKDLADHLEELGYVWH